MPRESVEFVVYTRWQEVLRESDAHLILLLETFTEDGALLHIQVIDPRDYEDD